MTKAKALGGAAIIACLVIPLSHAQSLGNPSLPSLSNPGLTSIRPNPPVYQGPGTYLNNGSQILGPNGMTQMQSGNQALGSEGSEATTYWNLSYGSNGSIGISVGNQTYVNNPGRQQKTCTAAGIQTICN